MVLHDVILNVTAQKLDIESLVCSRNFVFPSVGVLNLVHLPLKRFWITHTSKSKGEI
jgi:hypothetical protein